MHKRIVIEWDVEDNCADDDEFQGFWDRIDLLAEQYGDHSPVSNLFTELSHRTITWTVDA